MLQNIFGLLPGEKIFEHVRSDEEIKAHLSPAELDAIFDIGHYTRYESEIVDRVLAEK